MKSKSIIPFVVFPSLLYLLSYLGIPLNVLSLASFILGFLLCGLLEYTIHRFAFHNKHIPRKVKRVVSYGHVYHHRYPDRIDELILPIYITLPSSLIFTTVFYVLTGSTYIFWFYLGMVSSYFLYEFMHYSAHHFTFNLPYFKQMREYHLTHHATSPNNKFMITNPVYDWIFRSR